jgi:hypothetical protein
LARKVFTIIILALSLALFLYIRPYIFKKEAPPRIVDRLPSAEFLGKANILELARETSGMMFYNKIPLRDFTSYEFILSQSKMYGINLQKPVYLFGFENGNWGAIIHVSDSSKTANGIDRIKNFVSIRDTIISDSKVWFYPKERTYLHYDKNYLLIYKGFGFKKILEEVVRTKIHNTKKEWKQFLNSTHFTQDNLVIFSNWKKLNQLGFEVAMFAHDSDSLSFNLKSYLKKKSPFHISKKTAGIALKSVENPKKFMELHLNVQEFVNHPKDSLYLGILKFARKFGFPIIDFINAWNGDICFMEGGSQKVKEKYISTELDEEFNVREIEKSREVEVPGYSLLLSTNDKATIFVNRLFQKGYLRKDGKHFRFLFSPPLNFIQTSNFMMFYSGETAPKLILGEKNRVIWTNRETKYSFQIDSLNQHEIFGSMQIPVMRLFRRNKIMGL